MSNYVQLYKSTDQNASPVTGQSGSLLPMLNCCLVDGFHFTVSITGITRSGTTATATVSAADGLKLRTGQILTVSGASQTDYDITATITVASTTTFTYQVANSPTTPATGTITATSDLPITSIVRKGTGNLTALATLNNANATLVTGNYMTVAGCSGTGNAQYNGTQLIKCVAAWSASTAYAQGALVSNDTGKVFVCTTAGTSASSGGPTGTGTSIGDGGAVWDYVLTGAGTNLFTYQVGSDPGANASGSPVYYKAGLQWTRPFSAGTNAQTYRSADASSPQHYLQVIDNAATAGGAKEAQMFGAEVMTADQTVSSGRFPTTVQQTSGLCWRKSATADATVREWTLWGDDRTFYVQFQTGDTNGFAIGCFGYFISHKSGDAFNTMAGGGSAFNTVASGGMQWPLSDVGVPTSAASTALYVARSYTQTGSSINVPVIGFGGTTSTAYPCVVGGSGTPTSLITYPNGPDSGLYVQPYFLGDTTACLRGRVPGMYIPMHSSPTTQYDQTTGVVGLSGVTLTTISVVGHAANGTTNTPGQFMVDTFGPWS